MFTNRISDFAGDRQATSFKPKWCRQAGGSVRCKRELLPIKIDAASGCRGCRLEHSAIPRMRLLKDSESWPGCAELAESKTN